MYVWSKCGKMILVVESTWWVYGVYCTVFFPTFLYIWYLHNKNRESCSLLISRTLFPGTRSAACPLLLAWQRRPPCAGRRRLSGMPNSPFSSSGKVALSGTATLAGLLKECCFRLEVVSIIIISSNVWKWNKNSPHPNSIIYLFWNPRIVLECSYCLLHFFGLMSKILFFLL